MAGIDGQPGSPAARRRLWRGQKLCCLERGRFPETSTRAKDIGRLRISILLGTIVCQTSVACQKSR